MIKGGYQMNALPFPSIFGQIGMDKRIYHILIRKHWESSWQKFMQNFSRI